MRAARLSMGVVALALTIGAWAQAPAPPAQRPEANPTMPSPPAPGSTGTDRGVGTGASAKPGSMTSRAQADAAFVRDAGAASKAEVALGTLAVSKAHGQAAKDFGQKMVADHGKAYDELARIASGTGAAVPTEPTAAQKRAAAGLAKKSGVAFDREFAALMVSDHKKAVALFQNEAANGRDPDLQAFAAATLATLQEHLRMAEQLQSQLPKK